MGKSFKVLRNTVRDCTEDPQWIAELGYGLGVGAEGKACQVRLSTFPRVIHKLGTCATYTCPLWSFTLS